VMKKSSQFIAALIALCVLPFANLQAQLLRLTNGFDNYIGSPATVPSGWHISWNSTSSPSYYFTSGNYGAAIPSYKFGVTQDTIVSPHFLSGDTLSFWCNGQGTFSAQNVLSIFMSEDSISWSQLANLDSLPVTGTTFYFPLPCSAHFLKFIYYQVSGNLAFDDVKVTMTNYFPVAIPVTTLNQYCQGDTVCFLDQSTLMGCDNICNRLWSFGDGTPSDTATNPCHFYTSQGTYLVTLIVTTCNGNADTAQTLAAIYSKPVSLFIDSNTTGTIVSFTDMSSVSTGSITSWYWDFGDFNFSAQQNPTHLYSSIGTYYACLTVTTSNGCSNAFCDSVHVIGAGIDELNSSAQVFISPNPASGRLKVQSLKSGIERIEIYNMMGQNIFIRQISGHNRLLSDFDVSDFDNGLYFLKIVTENEYYLSRIIIAH
jgi:hypothetical protein